MSAGSRIGLFTVLTTLGVLTLGGGSAFAAGSLVSLEPGTLGQKLVIDGDGQVNEVTVGVDPAFPTAYLITDSGGILDPLPFGCIRLKPTEVRCFVNNIRYIDVSLEGGDDRFSVSAGSIPSGVILTVYGGENSDTIRGRDGPGSDFLYGEGGKDFLFGLGGVDTLSGGSGDDELDGGRDTDFLYGGDNDDVLNGGEGFFPDRLDGGAGIDILNGLAEDDKLFGGGGNDKLFGGGGDDKGIGGPGRDTFVGGKGTDRGRAEREKSVEK